MEIEWALVFFTLLACLSVGGFAGVAVSEWTARAPGVRQPGAVIALVTLAASGLASVLHLGHPERVFGALGHPTSGIFLEALLIGLYGLAVVFYILASRRGVADGARKGIAVAGMVPAICLAFAVGYTYVMPSRPAWDTLLLPLWYMASAAVLGCFAYAGLAARRGENGDASGAPTGKAALFSLLIQAALTAAYLIYLTLAPYPDATRSAGRVLAGSLSPLFWIGILILGLLIPGWLAARAKKATRFDGAWLGFLCVLIGGAAFRVMMFALGSSVRSFF